MRLGDGEVGPVERAKTPRRAPRRATRRASEVADFLDVAGHELRAPLTALKGHAQILQRRLAKQPERESDMTEMNKMLYQIGRLEHDLDVYLEAARLFDGRFRLQLEQMDLVAVAQRLVDLQRRGAAEDVIRLECDEPSLMGEWDRRRMQLALGVLVSNATKYGLGRETTLRLLKTESGVRVEVEDRGLGVPADERRSIFGAYFTGGNVENAGLGLGLYVAREIVKRFGGKIGVRARPDGGSLFWFEAPTQLVGETGEEDADVSGAEPQKKAVRQLAHVRARV